MSTTRLPELPEPSTRYYCNKCGQAGDTQRHHRPHGPECDYLAVAYKARDFTADQMHAYGLAVWKAAMDHAMAQLAAASVDGCYADAENLLAALPLPEQGSPQ